LVLLCAACIALTRLLLPFVTFTALQLSQLPLSCGIGGFLLARAAAEMLCEALAASWAAGCAAPVRRLMLLPQGIISAKPERMVSYVVIASHKLVDVEHGVAVYTNLPCFWSLQANQVITGQQVV
jgi:hypothetical protein